MKTVFFTITMLFCSATGMFAEIEPRTLLADFNGSNADSIYTVITAERVGTTFRMPEGVQITDFVVTDTEGFHAESNGTIGIVTALMPKRSTSVSIFTDNGRLFVFNLQSLAKAEGELDQLVVIKASNVQLFRKQISDEATRLTAEATARCEATVDYRTQQLLFAINSNYIIRDATFSIDRVVDDGIFTYIKLPKTQDRPVVYIGEKNDHKHLEPVKYTDEGTHYVVHRVLPKTSKERIFLKLGEITSEITRQ